MLQREYCTELRGKHSSRSTCNKRRRELPPPELFSVCILNFQQHTPTRRFSGDAPGKKSGCIFSLRTGALADTTQPCWPTTLRTKIYFASVVPHWLLQEWHLNCTKAWAETKWQHRCGDTISIGRIQVAGSASWLWGHRPNANGMTPSEITQIKHRDRKTHINPGSQPDYLKIYSITAHRCCCSPLAAACAARSRARRFELLQITADQRS